MLECFSQVTSQSDWVIHTYIMLMTSHTSWASSSLTTCKCVIRPTRGKTIVRLVIHTATCTTWRLPCLGWIYHLHSACSLSTCLIQHEPKCKVSITVIPTEIQPANFLSDESCSVIEALWLDIETAVLIIFSLDSKLMLPPLHIKLLVYNVKSSIHT